MRKPDASSVAEQAVSAGGPQAAGQAPVLVLKVQRGRTAARERPVRQNRFLIGSDRGCHLRLGGDEMPLLHSIVLARPEGYHLDAVASSPPLRINGHAVESVDLADGDLIEIGTFQLQVSLSPVSGNHTPQSTPASQETPIDHPEQPADPAELSAEELVDLLDAEMQMVDEFEAGTMLGADALLEAVRREAEQHSEAAPTIPIEGVLKGQGVVGETSRVSAEADSPELAIHHDQPASEESNRDLISLVSQLQDFVHGMDSRSQRATEREMFLAEAISEIFESQQQMAEQIEKLAEQLALLQSRDQSPTQRRAIA